VHRSIDTAGIEISLGKFELSAGDAELSLEAWGAGGRDDSKRLEPYQVTLKSVR
jgi:hypothetical protein